MTEAEFPFTFKTVSVRPLVLTVTMCLVLNPLTDVTVTSGTFPNTIAMLNAICPLAVVSVSVVPSVEALAGDFTLIVVTQILVAIAEAFVALSVALIVQPMAFIDAADLVNADALTLTMCVFKFTTI